MLISKRVVGWGVGILVVVTILVLVAAFIVGRRTSELSPTPTTSVLPATEHIAFDISYSRAATPPLLITSATRTTQPTTIEQYRPLPGSPYTRLWLIAADGQVLAEERFSVPTSIIGENLTTGGGQIISLPENDVRVIIAVPATEPLAGAVLATPQGKVLQHLELGWESLPNDTSALQSFQTWWRGLIPLAHAADTKYVIAVINEQGATTGPTITALQQMVATIEPWKSFQQSIQIEPVNNTDSLQCYTIPLKGRGSVPRCPQQPVEDAVRKKISHWDVIVVATNTNCGSGPGCGSVEFPSMPAILASGQPVTSLLLAHELGHAVGKMMDEDVNLPDGPLGPNCFVDEAACRNNTGDFPAAKCEKGCMTADSWRPASELMYNKPVPNYGPLEEKIMRDKIAAVVNKPAPPPGDPPAPPNPPPANPPGTNPIPPGINPSSAPQPPQQTTPVSVPTTFSFGNFEFELPGTGKSIDAFVTSSGGTPLLRYLGIIFNIIIALIASIAIIIIVIAGYFYLTAAGDSQQVGKAKTMVMGALLGLTLALTAYVLLEVVNPELGSGLKEPVIQK